MNPLTNMKNVLKLSEKELKVNSKTSWHDMYKDSAWIFVGGLPYDLTEGDIICVFSQYGEIVNINLVRDKRTGKQKGFCFLCYEDQRSTILAVDNLNGIKILGRIIRVDHVANYKPPKENENTDEEVRTLYMEGCAPRPQIREEDIKKEGVSEYSQASTSNGNITLPEKLSVRDIVKVEDHKKVKMKKEKKSKKEKRKKEKSKKERKSKKKKKRHSSTSNSSSDSESSTRSRSISKEKNTRRKRSRS